MIKILYICTHNRCRSILAEAITNHFGGGGLQAKSAGSQPSGEVHPLSIKYLAEANIPTNGLCSQSWDEHESWQPDIVITVCDSAANEPCPVWFGDAVVAHWGLKDPSKLVGSDDELAQAFNETINIIKQRVGQLLDLQLNSLDKQQLSLQLSKLTG